MDFKYSPIGIHKIAISYQSEQLPEFIKRAEGAYLYCANDRKIIDFSMGKCSVTLGHSYKPLNDVLIRQISLGQQFTLPPQSYEAFAQKLSSHSSEQPHKSIFLKNGSDAVRLSMRVARAHTNKKYILFCGYHSWQDEFLSKNWPRKGSLQSSYTINFYYDLDKLQELFTKYKNDIAAVIITPEPGLLDGNFYQEVKSLCQSSESLFIMDEVKCGYHEKIFGISEKCNLDPDIILLSKGVANGYPISVLYGKAPIIDASNQSIVFGTYFYDTYGLSLAMETFNIYKEIDVIERISQLGKNFVKNINALFEMTGSAAKVTGSYSLPVILFASAEEEFSFFEELLKRNILLYPGDNLGLSLSHDASVISQTLNAIEDSLRTLNLSNSSSFNFDNAIEKLSAKKMIDKNALDLVFL